jgi:hypothetical protein
LELLGGDRLLQRLRLGCLRDNLVGFGTANDGQSIQLRVTIRLALGLAVQLFFDLRMIKSWYLVSEDTSLRLDIVVQPIELVGESRAEEAELFTAQLCGLHGREMVLEIVELRVRISFVLFHHRDNFV